MPAFSWLGSRDVWLQPVAELWHAGSWHGLQVSAPCLGQGAAVTFLGGFGAERLGLELRQHDSPGISLKQRGTCKPLCCQGTECPLKEVKRCTRTALSSYRQ